MFACEMEFFITSCVLMIRISILKQVNVTNLWIFQTFGGFFWVDCFYSVNQQNGCCDANQSNGRGGCEDAFVSYLTAFVLCSFAVHSDDL